MNEAGTNFAYTFALPETKTAGDLARELSRSVPTIKAWTLELNISYTKAGGAGIWLYGPAAADALRRENTRRRREMELR